MKTLKIDGLTLDKCVRDAHLEVVNTRLGLKVSALVTPDLLRPWEDRL